MNDTKTFRVSARLLSTGELIKRDFPERSHLDAITSFEHWFDGEYATSEGYVLLDASEVTDGSSAGDRSQKNLVAAYHGRGSASYWLYSPKSWQSITKKEFHWLKQQRNTEVVQYRPIRELGGALPEPMFERA